MFEDMNNVGASRSWNGPEVGQSQSTRPDQQEAERGRLMAMPSAQTLLISLDTILFSPHPS